MSNRDRWTNVYDSPLGYGGPLHFDRVKLAADVKDGPKRRRKTRRDEKNDFSWRNWYRRDYYDHAVYPEGNGYAGRKATKRAPAPDNGSDDATDSVWRDRQTYDRMERLEKLGKLGKLDRFFEILAEIHDEDENGAEDYGYMSENVWED